MISLHKLNNDTVDIIPDLIGSGQDKRPVKGGHILDLYSNVFLVAKKRSGKTCTIFKILKECAGRDTIVVLFVPTLYKDVGWKNIRKYLDMKNIEHIDFTSIKDENNVDQLDLIVKDLDEEAEEAERNKDKPKEQRQRLLLDEEEPVKRKPKYRSPEFIFVFDDISNELKSKSVVTLVKKYRHYLSTCIYSSQYLNDMDPQSRKQIDTWLVFKGQPIEKLETIYQNADLDISFDDFVKIYKLATKNPYSFLYINSEKGIFKRNFNTEIKIKSRDILYNTK